MLPCLLFEDEHLLVVNKPAGLNTHAPSPYAGEGLYDWLRHREPRWATFAILHRLDKETSGVLVFGKSPDANRSLTAQFTSHSVQKIYHLLATGRPAQNEFTVKSSIARAGSKYLSVPPGQSGEPAVTHFRILGPAADNRFLIEARPETGRTHQIRVHAAEHGFPVVGDAFYGGAIAPRLCLHARQITFRHPVTGEELTFVAPEDFAADSRLALREALLDARETNSYRLIHGAADRWPGWHVDRLGDYLLSQAESPLDADRAGELRRLLTLCASKGAYHRILSRQARRTAPADASPTLFLGEPAAGPIVIRENALRFELSFAGGYSTGLFLDQRDNRRRLLTGHVAESFPLYASGAADCEVLNVFAYTCGFSLCAAKAGARTTSLDLSVKYLEWGRRNFALNQLDPARHEFLHGDAFSWLRRLPKKGRAFDVVILDPPTFSQSREHGTFQAEKDFSSLTAAALPLVKPGGVLLASTNAARLLPEDFLKNLTNAIRAAGRTVVRQHYVPQPPDFPIHRDQPAFLKTVWLQIS